MSIALHSFFVNTFIGIFYEIINNRGQKMVKIIKDL